MNTKQAQPLPEGRSTNMIIEDGRKLTWLYEREARDILKQRFENDGRRLNADIADNFVRQYVETSKAYHRRFSL